MQGRFLTTGPSGKSLTQFLIFAFLKWLGHWLKNQILFLKNLQRNVSLPLVPHLQVPHPSFLLEDQVLLEDQAHEGHLRVKSKCVITLIIISLCGQFLFPRAVFANSSTCWHFSVSPKSALIMLSWSLADMCRADESLELSRMPVWRSPKHKRLTLSERVTSTQVWGFFSGAGLGVGLAHTVVLGILAPQPGIEPGPPIVGVQSSNHWTTRNSQLKIHNPTPPEKSSRRGYMSSISPVLVQEMF